MALTTPSLGRTRTFYFLPITPIPLVHRGVLTTDAPFVGQAVTGTLSGASISIQP